MIFPLALAIIASLFSALVNHIDKYLISKAVKNADSRSLVLVSTIIAGSVMALIYLQFSAFFRCPKRPTAICQCFCIRGYVNALF